MTVRARLICAEDYEKLGEKVECFLDLLDAHGFDVLDIQSNGILIFRPEHGDRLKMCYAVVVFSDVQVMDNEGTRHVM